MSNPKPEYKLHGFRLPQDLVKEFEELAKKRGYTRQEAMVKIMQEWIDKD